MDKPDFNQQMIDRYVRNEMSEAQEAEFEALLLESPTLQDELELALALRGLLDIAPEAETDTQVAAQAAQRWPLFAMAASIAVALVTASMLFSARHDLTELRSHVEALSGPVGTVLTVPVNIMRSSGRDIPDVIVQRPPDDAVMLLDIELGTASRDQDVLTFELVSIAGEPLMSWTARPNGGRSSSAVLRSHRVPVGQFSLNIRSSSGDLLERRFIEFK